ncbi:PREDICTED: F-box only protein 5-like [Amphimedon queenslandica]|nr:PREDICTED: F-box only protein 5-like [Amphimedon queenslandica]|eukprot:XP_011410497.2 PREDICTED: F-box only protein 5-like [Amphimedon queenslandica]
MTSSAFLTPPSSLSKDEQPLLDRINSRGLPRSHLPSPPLLRFSLLTPGKEEGERKVDFISSLYPPFAHIAYQVFSHLSPSDLISCASVSKKWREVILSKPSFIHSIKSYQRQMKSNQENLIRPFRELSNCFEDSIAREPLTQRRINQVSSLYISSSSISYRNCPQCSSPRAKRLPPSKMAHCDCCNFSFCCDCLKKAHGTVSCQSTSPTRKSSLVAGGKPSRKRLKRL